MKAWIIGFFAFWFSFAFFGCGGRRCVTKNDCMFGEYCVSGACKTPPEESDCFKDGDCQEGYLCNQASKKCSKAADSSCGKNSDCSPNYYCDLGGNLRCKKLPNYVSMRLNSVILRPIKADGTQWDSTFGVPSFVSSFVLQALGLPGPAADISGKFIEWFSTEAAKSLSKPDPRGYVTFSDGYNYPNVSLPEQGDNFNPTWNTQWFTLTHNTNLKIQVFLEDVDAFVDDSIGTVVVSYNGIKNALSSGKVHTVRTAEQDTRQILFLTIQVIPK